MREHVGQTLKKVDSYVSLGHLQLMIYTYTYTYLCLQPTLPLGEIQYDTVALRPPCPRCRYLSSPLFLFD